MTGKAWRNGSPAGWRALRAWVLARDGFTCQLRLDGCTGSRELEVHHTLGAQASGIVCDPQHLVTACRTCNRSVGNPAKTDPPPRKSTRW